jgi:hypothetical protein
MKIKNINNFKIIRFIFVVVIVQRHKIPLDYIAVLNIPILLQ